MKLAQDLLGVELWKSAVCTLFGIASICLASAVIYTCGIVIYSESQFLFGDLPNLKELDVESIPKCSVWKKVTTW